MESSVSTVSVQPVVPTAVPAPSWWESFKQFVSHTMDRMNLTIADISHMIVFFIGGFLLGLVLCRYGRFFLSTLLVLIVVFALFDYLGIVSLQWSRVQQVTGVNPNYTLVQCWQAVVSLIRGNLLITFSTVIGFLVGYGVGSR